MIIRKTFSLEKLKGSKNKINIHELNNSFSFFLNNSSISFVY